jgi:hypothetical protein
MFIIGFSVLLFPMAGLILLERTPDARILKSQRKALFRGDLEDYGPAH